MSQQDDHHPDEQQAPDHRLESLDTETAAEAQADEEPEIYAVSDLRAFVKPDLDEELGAPMGDPAQCGTEVTCTCVPVESCVCNTVEYHTGGSSCPQDCPCQGVCVSLYWYPT